MSETTNYKSVVGNNRSEAIAIARRPRLHQKPSEDSFDFSTPTQSPSMEHRFVVPSPILSRRMRTFSTNIKATESPIHQGECKFFSRSKGHGFIQPTDGCSNELIFMHISDIESEYIPLPGDSLSFKLSRIPPKNEKFQAVEVRILNLFSNDDPNHSHTRWNEAPSHH